MKQSSQAYIIWQKRYFNFKMKQMSNNIPHFVLQTKCFQHNWVVVNNILHHCGIAIFSNITEPNSVDWKAPFTIFFGTFLDFKVRELKRGTFFQFQHNQLCNDEKDVKTMNEAKTRFHVFCSCWLLFGVAIEKDIIGLSKWLGSWHFYYRHWGGHTILVSVSSLCILQRSLIFYIHTIYRDGAHQVAPTV